MTTSPTSTLCKPTGSKKIPASTLSYMRTRFRQRIHSLILKEFTESGIQQIDLARRLGKKRADTVCRWLAAPANFRLSTLSDILFAVNGGELVSQVKYPMEQLALNDTVPSWLLDDSAAQLTDTPDQGPVTEGNTVTELSETKSYTNTNQQGIVGT